MTPNPPPSKYPPLPTLHTYPIPLPTLPNLTLHAHYTGRTIPFTPSNYYTETLALGVAAYTLVSGRSALLFDAGLAPPHAAQLFAHVEALGATELTLVYSHFHADHVAGGMAVREAAEAAGCGINIIAHEGTLAQLREDAEDLASPEDNDDEDDDPGPPITAALPTTTFSSRLDLHLGSVPLQLHNFAIHTPDSTLLYVPAANLALAGDMLEDVVTYFPSLASAADLRLHLRELARLRAFLPRGVRILPAHGCPERIAGGGYECSLTDATERYLRKMLGEGEGEGSDSEGEPRAWGMTLREVVEGDVEAGTLVWCQAYEGVHAENVGSLREVWAREGGGEDEQVKGVRM